MKIGQTIVESVVKREGIINTLILREQYSTGKKLIRKQV